MKVILLHEVPGLGQPGDVKVVADGYARNYLLPRQLVTAATPAALNTLRERVAAEQRRAEKRRAEHAGLASRIAATTLTFAVRVGHGDRLYGSVTSQDIANALQEQEGLIIDRRTIQLREPLRQLGTFEVGVRVAPQVEPKLTVILIPQGTESALTQPPAPASTQDAAQDAVTTSEEGEAQEPAAAETPAQA
jgi:large subunit ribosomal protein L9